MKHIKLFEEFSEELYEAADGILDETIVPGDKVYSVSHKKNSEKLSVK